MSLRSFEYVAAEATGEIRRGQIRGQDASDAFRRVRAAGLTPIELEPVREPRPLLSRQRVNASDVAGLTRELAVLVEARIPLDRGLATIAEHADKESVRTLVRDMAATIEAGSPMTEALERHESVFGEVYIETVRAAERSGNLLAVMSHLAEMLDRQIESRQQLRRALSYPLIVLGVVVVALVTIIVFVIPRFGATFDAHGVEMPVLTQLLKAVGESMRSWWWAYGSGLGGLVVGLLLAWQTHSGRREIERWLTRMPYVRSVISANSTGRFARVMSIGLSSGLDVIDSLLIGGRATGRATFATECDQMADRLRAGEELAQVLRGCEHMPSFARRMIGAGKDSAELAKACDIVARHFDREATHLTRNINSVIEPLLTVGMAIIVLVVALSVFLPMWQMVRINQ